MKFLIVILSVLIFVFAVKQKYKFTPVNILVYMWTLQIVFATLFLDDLLILDYNGFLIILLLITCALSGFWIASKLNFRFTKFGADYSIKENRLFFIVCVLAVLSFFEPVYKIISSLGDIGSFDSLAELNNKMAQDRYWGKNSQITGNANWDSLFMCFYYLSAVTSGFAFLFFKSVKRKAVTFSFIIPAVIIAFTQAMKLQLISGVFLWISGFLVFAMFNNVRIKISKKMIFLSALVITGFFGILFMSMILKIGRVDNKSFETVKSKFITYSFGHLSCFGQWFDEYYKFKVYCDKHSFNPCFDFYCHGVDLKKSFIEKEKSSVFSPVSRQFINSDTFDILNGSGVKYGVVAPSVYFFDEQMVKVGRENGSYLRYITLPDPVYLYPGDTVSASCYTYLIARTPLLPKFQKVVFGLNDETNKIVITPCFDSLNTWTYHTNSFINKSDSIIKVDSIELWCANTAGRITDTIGEYYVADPYISYGLLPYKKISLYISRTRNDSVVRPYVEPEYYYGKKTFLGITNILGLCHRPIGLYKDMITISYKDHRVSNVYTLFRILIEDFSIIGSCIYLFIIGFFIFIMSDNVKNKYLILISIPLLLVSYFNVFWAFATTIFVYTSFFLTFFMFFVILLIVCKRSSHK